MEKLINKSSQKKSNISNNNSSKQLIDQILSKDIDKKIDSLKSFKIPKQHTDKSKVNELSKSLNDYSSEASRSNCLTSKHQTNYSNLDSINQQHKSYAPYYHPKKNQFRQYMMESISSNNEINQNNKSLDSSKNLSSDNRFTSQYANQDYYNNNNNNNHHESNNDMYKNNNMLFQQSYSYQNNMKQFSGNHYRSGKYDFNEPSSKQNPFGTYNISNNKKF
jgi:hypothetical protein